MTAQPRSPQDRPIQILLIDQDPAFRAGFGFWLNQYTDLQLAHQAESGAIGLSILDINLNLSAENGPSLSNIDIVVMDVGLGRSQPDQMQGLVVCQQIRQRFPSLPILLLSSFPEPVMLAAAQQAGALGYCPKTLEPEPFAQVIRHVANGQPVWVTPQPSRTFPAGALTPDRSNRPSTVAPAPTQPGSWMVFRHNLRRNGLRQIEDELANLTEQLQSFELSLLDRAIAAGRHRELRAARWLVARLLATPHLDAAIAAPSPIDPTLTANSQPLTQRETEPERSLVLASTTIPELSRDRDLQSLVFDAVLTKLPGSLQNQTDIPLETDILRENRKRELFYLVLRQLEELLSELRFSQVQPDQLAEKRSQLLVDLWQMVVTDFFGKYSTLDIRGVPVEFVNVLLAESLVIQAEILEKIPFTLDLLAHLLFQTPLTIEDRTCPPGNPEALARAEMILENWMIQTANAVMQPLINRFGDVEEIKQNFYDVRLMSSREIERFRNSLSWKYRMAQLFTEPKQIFESQYSLFILYGNGIKFTAVYAPRKTELEQLAGIRLAVTLALETRDALAPRVRSVLSVLGSGFIYILTDVVGKGIGLIGRGILKGVGGAWQEGKVGRESDRSR